MSRGLRAYVWSIGAAGLLCSWGCGMGRGSEGASSGDPEANRRAEMRIGSEGESSGVLGKEKPARTLYERLGGEKTIVALVDDVTERVMNDPRVNFERHQVSKGFLRGNYDPWQPSAEHVGLFKKHMVEFLTLASGGPTQYTGRDMGSVHKGMRIGNSEFDAFVGDVKTSMDKMGLPTREKKDLLAVIETTRKEIVERQ
jgi:hemoglobin